MITGLGRRVIDTLRVLDASVTAGIPIPNEQNSASSSQLHDAIASDREILESAVSPQTISTDNGYEIIGTGNKVNDFTK